MAAGQLPARGQVEAAFVQGTDHGALGDGSLIAKQKAMMQELQGRALELKREGKSADEAGKLLTAELHAKHPDYGQVERIAADVKLVYTEAQ